MTPAAPVHRFTLLLRLSLTLFLAILTAFLLAFAIAQVLYGHPTHDQSWLLYAASRLLHGAHLYGPQLTETNPPLAIWLSAIPSALVAILHTPTLLTARVVFTLVIFASAAWCTRILRSAGLVRTPALTCLVFAAIFALDVLIWPLDFGQRENILVVLVLPYLLLTLLHANLRFALAERLALGVAAAVGICLKPHQLLLILAFELFLLLWNRNPRELLRPELLAFATTICAYILSVAVLTPLYFRQTIPLLRDTYWAFDRYPTHNLLRTSNFNHPFAYALVLWLLVRRYLRYPVAPAAILAASLGAYLAYALQHKGFHYQFFPPQALLCLAFGWIALDLLSHDRLTPYLADLRPIVLAPVTLVLLALTLLPFLSYERRIAGHDSHIDAPLRTLLAPYPPGTSVYVFSTELLGFEIVLNNHLVWASRYAHLWLLPAILVNEQAQSGGPPAHQPLTPARTRQLAALQRSTSAQDLHDRQPSIVLVQHCDPANPCQGIEKLNFNALTWFLADPNFAQEWSNYRLQTTTPQFDLYARTPPP